MSENQPTQPEVLPVPPDFPVQWADPADETFFWSQERVHFPKPSTPLEFVLVAQPIYEGLNRASKSYGIPFLGAARYINTYVYEGYLPADFVTDPGFTGDEYLQNLYAAMQEMGNHWENEWLPEVKTHLAYWEAFDLEKASLAALRDHLDETVQRLTRMWEIHNRLWYVMYLAMSLYDELYLEVIENASPMDAYQLLTGVETRTTAGNQALWALSRQALASPTVYQILTTQDARAVSAALRNSSDGQAFLAGLNEFLQQYGKRSDGFRLRDVSWLEDPTPVIRSIQGYIAQPDRDLAAELQHIAAKSAQQVANLKKQMAQWPQPVVENFETLFAAAQMGYVLSEDHTYWIDFQTVYHTRQIILAYGQRLVQAGLLAAQDDVFYLTLDELRHAASATTADYQTPVQERRHLDQHFAQIIPPPMLGTVPSAPPPDDPIMRSFSKFLGDPLPPAEAPNEIRGHTGSPGVTQGRAKVVLTLAEADKIAPGDILVAQTTILPWTPLFANISGLITDSGGILCHSAIVAREYGIPAVVGTGMATSVIQDGQLVEVDGNRGLVRILSSS